MHIITRKRLNEFARKHADAAGLLRAWVRVIEGARFAGPHELKQVLPHASIVGDWRTVFNIGGNKYRLIVDMRYDLGRVYVRAVMTHEEYNRVDVTKV
jgi:mRNA interferase HigB